MGLQVLHWMRTRKVLPYIPNGGILVDIGCGNPPVMINLVKNDMEHCFGIDDKVEDREYENVTLLKVHLNKIVPLPDEMASVVTMLDTFERLEHPQAIVNELYRILFHGGLLLVIIPTLIPTYKQYFNQSDLKEIFMRSGFRTVDISSFKLSFCTFIRATK